MIIQQMQVSGKFRYLWLKKVTGVLLSYHCATCLRGTYDKRVNNKMECLTNAELEAGIYYLCGVCTPYNWANNFHLAFQYIPGSTLEVCRNGIAIRIQDAMEIPISDKFIDESNPHANDRKYRTCRNWQFANWYKKAAKLYLCDPEKNTACRKTICQRECKATVHREYAKLDANSEPIVVFLKDEGNNNGRC